MNLFYRVSKNLVTKQLDYFGHFEKNSSRLSYRIFPHMYLEKKRWSTKLLGAKLAKIFKFKVKHFEEYSIS